MAGDFLAVCVPHMGVVAADWAVALRLLEIPIPFKIFSTKSIPIQQARNWLVRQALQSHADWILFLDADVMLPPRGLKALWRHQLPVVSALVGTKHGEPAVLLKDEESGKRWAVRAETLTGEILLSHPSLLIGLGCCLIRADIFKTLPYPWFQWSYDPWTCTDGLSEDLGFSELLHSHGITIHVDTTVHCIHLGEATIGPFGEAERLQFIWELTGSEERRLWPTEGDGHGEDPSNRESKPNV